MKAHPFADLFPLLEPEQHAELVASIRANGVLQPITVMGGMILDGRNRFKAAAEVGIPCPAVPFKGTDPLAFVVSSNLHRRHLTTAQRGEIAAKLATMENGSNRYAKKVGQSNDGPTAAAAVSVKQAAALMGVSESTVTRAKAAQRPAPVDAPVQNTEELRPAKTAYLEHTEEVEATLSKAQHKDFERLMNAERKLLQAYLDEEAAKQRELFRQAVDEGVQKLLPEIAREAQQKLKDVLKRERKLWEASVSLRQLLSDEDHKLLLNVLHPDRAPEDRKDRFSKAFKIALDLGQHIALVKEVKAREAKTTKAV